MFCACRTSSFLRDRAYYSFLLLYSFAAPPPHPPPYMPGPATPHCGAATQFIDSHFHVWDVSNRESSAGFCDRSVLFAPESCRQEGVYDFADYEADIAPCGGAGFQHIGGVFVEAMSVQHAGMSPELLNEKCVQECQWVISRLRMHGAATTPSKPYRIVASACLEAENAEETLQKLCAMRISGAHSKAVVVGIRQILNHAPSWPRNDALGDLTQSAAWRRGYGLLEKHGLSFDAQANPHQLARLHGIAQAHPGVPLAVNHIGTPAPKDLEDPERREGYLSAMRQLAALPHCSVKISMLCYASPSLCRDVLRPVVTALLDAFGAQRVMVGSNYPVDLKDGHSITGLLQAASDLLPEGLSAEDRGHIFSGSAARFYKF
eukprot:TRINITY_DN4453_c0_g1_i1.p1 TRINITY_DN4453_c0_g1~~TRINITY_DN4453_c0_g1_i1.p1  ORF type:complete len:376 (+),score=98.81 TRINITY_DN4453_c0_g1_i1:319-1446(+)